MTSTSGDGPPNDDPIDGTNQDAEADESFATAADEWQYQAESDGDTDERPEIAKDEEPDDLPEVNGDYFGDVNEDTVSRNDSLGWNQEDDTLRSLDEELRAQQDASDSSIFQGPSPQASERSTPESSRPSSGLSSRRRSAAIQPFDRRAQVRKPSASSIASIRNVSPAFLTAHSRQSSISSQITTNSVDREEEEQIPWEVVRWTKLRKVSSQLFSEAGRRAFGLPSYLAVGALIVVGTSKGLVMLFDYQQNLKHIVGQGTPAAECGPVSALAISADHSTIAAGHASGFIFTWDLSSSAKPFLTIPPIPRKTLATRTGDGHVADRAVLHVGFLGTRHTALVSADDSGMAFSHLATRGLGAVGRTVKTTRLLGRYPDINPPPTQNARPSTVLAFAALPLGNIVQPTDDIGLTALLTPYLLVVVSTTPVAQTQFKTARTKEAAAHGAMTGCLAWFPAVKLKTAMNDTPVKVAKTKLAYCWSNVLTLLEVEAETVSDNDEDKRPPLHFHVRRHWKCEEAIVAVQWISRSVLALLTITQRLVILEDQSMHVTDTSDLNPRHIYHRDLFSRQLEPLVSKADQEDKTMHGVVPDAYTMSFKAYKSRLFLLDSSDVSMGTLSNWADRLVALMEAGRLIEAVELATVYYNGSADKVTVGLPDEDSVRHPMVKDRLLQMIAAALRYTFKMDESDELGKDLRTALQELVEPIFIACTDMHEADFLFDDVYEWYSDASCQDAFLHALEPRILEGKITSIPTEVLKDMMNWYATLGMGQRLQGMICSLETATLDIDQVTSLCKELNLYDAFIYVWNQAVGDYVTPLSELIHLTEGLDEDEDSPRHESALKMFPYLAYILTGRVYPEGSEMPSQTANHAQSTVYEYLFDSTHYTPLRLILHFSTPDLMSTLNETFEDPCLNDRAPSPSPEVEEANGTTFSINRQRIVNILLDVLSSDFDHVDRIYLNIFIARNLPKYPQYILLPGRTLNRILTELCSPPDEELQDECQLAVEYLLSVYRPSDMQSLIPLFESARFFRVLKATYKAGRQFGKWLETHFNDPAEPQAVFDAARDCFRPSMGLSQRQLKDVKGNIVAYAKSLAELDVGRTAGLLRDVCPELLEDVYTALAGAEQAQYLFLRELLEPQEEQPQRDVLEQFATSHKADYITLLCQFDPSHVSAYVTTVAATSLNLDAVLPVMERTGVIDAAVVLMVNEGLQQNALDRLIAHLGSLRTALVGFAQMQTPNLSPSGIDEVVHEARKYTKLGIWLCQGGGRAADRNTSSAPTTQPSQPKLSQSDLIATLTPQESHWLALLTSVVDLCRAFTSAAPAPLDPSHPLQTAITPLRQAVHQTSTALLASSTSNKPSQPRLLPILRAFLNHLSEQTNSASDATLKPILASIFESYDFQASILSLAHALLAKNTFADYASAVEQKRRGWRASSRACARCGIRIWGVGAGGDIWDAWAARTHTTKREDGERGKGKARETRSAGSTGEGKERGVIVLACSHIFHAKCLGEGWRSKGWDVSREGVRDVDRAVGWKCLVCD